MGLRGKKKRKEKREREEEEMEEKDEKVTKQARDQTCLDCSRVALSSNGRWGSTSNFLNYDFSIFFLFFFNYDHY